MCICPEATHAPVLPAEITASQGLSAFCEPSLAMTTIDESGLARTACAGESPISITSGVWMISSRGSDTPRSERWARIASSRPTSTRCSSGARMGRASMTPFMIASGAWSPPITSMAMRIGTG